MRCILCHNISFYPICRSCQNDLLIPHETSRTLENGFKVYSFYKYRDIELLLKTKHTHLGASVYRILADRSFKLFKKRFSFENMIDIVPVDDVPKSGYSHTAILAKSMKTRYLKPCFNVLRAQNAITYSAKSLKYRQLHPRGFIYSRKRYENVILIDDIVTTGTTLIEAKKVIEKSGARLLFALTLADASDL